MGNRLLTADEVSKMIYEETKSFMDEHCQTDEDRWEVLNALSLMFGGPGVERPAHLNGCEVMSHGLTVPQGWTRGRELIVLGQEPRIAIEQKFDMGLDPVGSLGRDDVGYITFDTKEDAMRFIRWWQCPCKCSPAGEDL
jgi:hypothetical protein